ncbi:hypothetical protein ABEY24_20665 [Peribacillus frigoritolerans]
MIRFEMEVVRQNDKEKKINRYKGEISLSLFKLIPIFISAVEISQKLLGG